MGIWHKNTLRIFLHNNLSLNNIFVDLLVDLYSSIENVNCDM